MTGHSVCGHNHGRKPRPLLSKCQMLAALRVHDDLASRARSMATNPGGCDYITVATCYLLFGRSAKIRSSNRCAVRDIVRCVLELGGAIQFRSVGNDTPSISASSAELTRKVSRAFRNVRACFVSFVAIRSPIGTGQSTMPPSHCLGSCLTGLWLGRQEAAISWRPPCYRIAHGEAAHRRLRVRPRSKSSHALQSSALRYQPR